MDSMILTRILDRMEDCADKSAEWIETHKLVFLFGFSVIYFVGTVVAAAHKRFWFDELFTYYIAHAPKWGDIWTMLEMGIDHHPPTFYWVTRIAGHLTANAHIADRLPEILGFWLMSVCLFLFVARRTSALYGAIAMMGPYVTGEFFYAYEARPYGLVVGFCALGLLAWQTAADGRHRRLALAGVALSLAAAISSSYYAVLLVAPFALAELVRSLYRKAIDWAMWCSLAVGASVSFLYLPLVSKSIGGFGGPSWDNPTNWVFIQMYNTLFGPVSLVLVLILAAFGIYWVFRGRAQERVTPLQGENQAGPHEIAAGVALLLLPVLAFLVAVLVTNRVTARYALSALVGFGILLGFAFFRAARGSALAGLSVLLISFAATVAIGVLRYSLHSQSYAPPVLLTMLTNQPSDLPVIVDNPRLCLEMAHYEPRDVTARFYYVVDPPSNFRYASIPYSGRTWLKLRRVMPVNAEELAVFRKRYRRFLLYTSGSELSYVADKLTADGAALRVLAARGQSLLYEVNDVVAPSGQPELPR